MRIFSEEHRRKLSEAGKGRKHSEEVKRKIGKAGKGRKHTEETKIKMSLAQKGKPSWNKDKKLSEETKRKISQNNARYWLGKKRVVSEETRKKMGEIKKRMGLKPPSHKGRTYKEIYGDRWQDEIKKRSETHIKFYDRKGRNPQNRNKHSGIEYVKWRTKVYQRDNWTCQTCQIRGSYLQAHHIKSWRKYPELRYKINNGVTLCRECHKLANKEQRRYERTI